MKLGQLQLAALLVFSLASIGVIVAQNITATDNATNITIPIDACTGIICDNSSITCPDSFVASCEDTCAAGACSACTPSCAGHEATANATLPLPTENATTTPSPTPVLSPTPAAKPNLDVQIVYPEKVTRNSLVTITANITNLGNATAKNIAVNWQLPSGFAIVSTKQNCINIESSSTCTSEIAVQTSLSTALGPNSVKVVVNYE